MPNKPIIIRNVVQAAHLVLTGYGHWLPNGPRGSGSSEIRQLGLESLGPIHLGRKLEQPSRTELREFHEAAKPILKHDVIWFDEPIRELIAAGIAQAALQAGYTVWACAILRNHLHLVIRTHRHDSLTMLTRIAGTTFELLHESGLVPVGHPVWSDRPYKVFLKSAADVRRRIKYVWENPMKEGLPPQTWEFVTNYLR